MNILEFTVTRATFDDAFTLGRMLLGATPFAYTCEDTDREMEKGGVKVPGQTAIPRGRYRLTATLSTRFGRLMPLVEDVPGFAGIRIHGGNTAADTEGCILIGRTPTDTGVQNCAERVETIIKTIVDAEENGSQCWLVVK